MKQQHSFRRTVGWLTIISAPFAYANFVLTGIAGANGSQQVTDLYDYFGLGANAGNLMKWSWLADLLGYYLLLVPAAFLLHYWLKKENPYWMGVFTFNGLAYLLAGSIGAVILAKTWPTLMGGYASSEGISREIYRVVFTNTTEMVYGGIWGFLEFLLAGIWWLGVGFTMGTERKALGIVTIVLGLFAIITALGEIFGFVYVALIGLAIYLLLAPIWAVWLGTSLLKEKDIELGNP